MASAVRGCGASHMELQICSGRRMVWKGRPKRVKVPYSKLNADSETIPQVLRDTRNPVGIREDHLLRLNTTWRPIVNQYREGKVKSTAGAE